SKRGDEHASTSRCAAATVVGPSSLLRVDGEEGGIPAQNRDPRFGAQGRTRTCTDFSTRPSNVRVYQFRHLGKERYFFAGAAGAAGAVCPLMTELRGRACSTARDIEVMTKAMKKPVVSLCSSVVAPRAPNAVCDPPPPNAPARSAPFPCCRRTTRIRKMLMKTCRMTSKTVIEISPKHRP